MKTSHPSAQETFASYFLWCHILEAASSHIILPSQLQMLQCVYRFLQLGGRGRDPKQTDQPKTTTRKLWVGLSTETKEAGKMVCTEDSLGANARTSCMAPSRKGGLAALRGWGWGRKEQNQVIRKVTCQPLLGFCLVFFIKVVLPLP